MVGCRACRHCVALGAVLQTLPVAFTSAQKRRLHVDNPEGSRYHGSPWKPDDKRGATLFLLR
jgi:hypothetical protein